jgi:hypothetical protein
MIALILLPIIFCATAVVHSFSPLVVLPPRRGKLECEHSSVLLPLSAKRVPRTESDRAIGDSAERNKPLHSRRVRSIDPPVVQRRAPHQFDHRQEQARPFINATDEIQKQSPNENADPFTLFDSKDGDERSTRQRQSINHAHIETYSLDTLFPGFQLSELFASSTLFRNDLRDAIREDIFDTTPSYHHLSDKARRILLLPDSSLQGSWQCQTLSGTPRQWALQGESVVDDKDHHLPADNSDTAHRHSSLRMTRLTKVLQAYLGPTAPSGDEFMDTIGGLCRKPNLTTVAHWMDIVGVQKRRVPHSWHQDTGKSSDNCRTVLWGFPPTDYYDGVGVFSHVIKLSHEQWKPSNDELDADTQSMVLDQPIVYPDAKLKAAVAAQQRESQDVQDDGALDSYIVRPRFAVGQEIIAYRDVDVLHSSPDIAYRTSLMRFM